MRKKLAEVAFLVLIMATVLSVGVPVAGATVNESGYCWVPDVEFPVPCDDDEDD